MGIDTFDKFILPSAVEKARDKYVHSSPEFFFGMARNHDVDAINLLFDAGKKVISRAFWKYYLGPNRAVWKQRIRDRDDWEFASEVYAMLLGNGKAANPLLTFDPSVFDEGSLGFVINKFNYYLMRYAQNLAWVMNREKNMQGMTGNMKKGDKPQFISKDSGTGEGGEGPSMEGSFSDMGEIDSAYETTEQSIEVQQFLNWVKTKRPDLYQVAVLGANGYSPKDIEQKLGISAYHVKNKQAALKGEYMKNFAESVSKTSVKEGVGDQPFDVEPGQEPLEFYDATQTVDDLWDIMTDMLFDAAGGSQGMDLLKAAIEADEGGEDPFDELYQRSAQYMADFFEGEDVFIDDVDKNTFKRSVLRYIEGLRRFVERM